MLNKPVSSVDRRICRSCTNAAIAVADIMTKNVATEAIALHNSADTLAALQQPCLYCFDVLGRSKGRPRYGRICTFGLDGPRSSRQNLCDRSQNAGPRSDDSASRVENPQEATPSSDAYTMDSRLGGPDIEASLGLKTAVRTHFRTLPIILALLTATPAMAQAPMLQQKVAQAKQLMTVNKQQLGHYTWQVQETVSVDGNVKQESIYQVQLGPDGNQVRTLVSQPVAPDTGGRQHGIKHRVKEDYQDYAQSVGALAKSYAQLSGSRVQQLYAQGEVALRAAGAPGYSAIVISNYFKPGDSIVVTVSDSPKAISSVNVRSYLSQPSDGVTIQVRYAKLPDGTSYAAMTTVNGQSKNLSIVDQSSNFAPRTQ